MGWADMWAESHRLLKRAALDFPDHAEINEALTAGKVYSCKPNRVVDVMTNAFIADHFDTMSLEPADMADASSNTVYTSRSPMLDPHECALAVAAVEAHVAQIGNWSTSRHYSVPTTDVPVHAVPANLEWFNRELSRVIFPAVGAMFDVDMTRLRVVDAFLVKYSAGKQRELPIHSDQSQFSLTIAINPASEYDGGGTYFFDVDATAKCDVGGFVVFPGHMAHGGAAITRGVRYIIAAFLYLSDEDDE
eukprot:m.207469 g.207469  ORF g.207469 m.207469 type:complete len:248 (-) comp25393_c1_seq1:1944-2687(-)